MSKIKRICVYCGSGLGNSPAYTAAARQFGEILAHNGIRLIYGCGSTGLMGTIARAVHDNGGEVTGIIATNLEAGLNAVPEMVKSGAVDERTVAAKASKGAPP